MLELYHHGSSVCAAKVRLTLAEKKLEWQGHYIDILKGEQFDPEYLRLNPKAVVPTLVHDGFVLQEVDRHLRIYRRGVSGSTAQVGDARRSRKDADYGPRRSMKFCIPCAVR